MLTRAATLALALGAATARAQTFCGFEAPAYHTGGLGGQGAWTLAPAGTPAGFAQVVTSPRRAGSQAARLSQQALPGDAWATWAVNAVLGPAQDRLDVEWDMDEVAGSGYGWTVDLRAPNNVRLGMLWVSGGNIWYKVWSRDPLLADGFLNPGQWGRFKVSLDWSARTTEFFLNGSRIAQSSWAGAPARGVGVFEAASVSNPGFATDALGLDSITVTAASPACPADFNGDGFLDFFDYADFVDCFESGICPPGTSADFNADGFADFFDYDAFLSAFERGC
jgi:hypothetical protein